MKKFKLLPVLILLIFCLGAFAVGIYSIAPSQNSITGTITINAAEQEVIISVFTYNEQGELNTTPVFGPKSTRTGIEIPLIDLTFDLNNINEGTDLYRSRIKFLIRLQNPEEQALGAYFSTNIVENEASVTDIKTETPLTAVLNSDKTKVNSELVSARFPNAYTKLPGSSRGKNGECSVMLEFALNKVPEDNFNVKINQTTNPIYFNIEKFNEGITDSYFAANSYEVVGEGGDAIDSTTYKNNTSLTKVKIAEGVKTISATAFYGCTNLTDVYIPNSVTSIGNQAFSNSNLKELYIPASVTSISSEVTKNCPNLMQITVHPDNTDYKSGRSSAIIAKSGLYLLAASNSSAYFDGVKKVNTNAFYGLAYIKEIILPESVTALSSSAMQFCTGVQRVVLSSKITSIPLYAFYSCTNLTSITLSEAITDIGNYAFQKSGIVKINIPSKVKTIYIYCITKN